LEWPQVGHALASRVPHSIQNLAFGWLLVPQLVQFTMNLEPYNAALACFSAGIQRGRSRPDFPQKSLASEQTGEFAARNRPNLPVGRST
jgi:hypothetical protein